MKHGYIYIITHIPSGRYYIGQHKSICPTNDNYLGSGAAWKKILAAHPKEEFSKQILAYSDDPEELDKLEAAYVGDLYNSDKLCKNLMTGGNTHKWSDESRKKLSASKTGVPVNLSDKARRIKSEMMSGKNNPMFGIHMTGKENPFYGKKHTEATKEKLRKINTGKKISKESREKMSLSHTGHKFSKEHNERISKARKGKCWISEDGKKRIGIASRNRICSDTTKKLLSSQRKGRHWYNNGAIETFTYSCPDGFSCGRLKR